MEEGSERAPVESELIRLTEEGAERGEEIAFDLQIFPHVRFAERERRGGEELFLWDVLMEDDPEEGRPRPDGIDPAVELHGEADGLETLQIMDDEQIGNHDDLRLFSRKISGNKKSCPFRSLCQGKNLVCFLAPNYKQMGRKGQS